MLRDELNKIASYTRDHSELQQAHHWLFDLRYPTKSFPELAIVGLNPGEHENDWRICPLPTEETSRFDYHDVHGNGRGSLNWTKLCSYFSDNRPFVQTELFFWSSRNSQELRSRYGRIDRSSHLTFCRDMNHRLLDTYGIRAVVCTGLTNYDLCRDLYGLGLPLRVHRSNNRRVFQLHHDGRRPWLFTKHWTGSFGFSRAEREAVREAINELLN